MAVVRSQNLTVHGGVCCCLRGVFLRLEFMMSGQKIKIHREFEQGSLQWLTAKKGVISASNVKHMVTSTLKVANNDKTRSYTCRLIAERVTDFIEENYVSFDMMRGKEDEIYAREKYSECYEKVEQVGFVTNSKHGFLLGCSPDGLVGDEGMVEIKSRLSKIQVQHILEYLIKGEVPPGDVMQVQASLLATKRLWCDYIVYSGGLPMAKIRVYPDETIQEAIIEACLATEKAVVEGMERYLQFVKPFPMTQYIPYTGENIKV